MNTKRRNHYDVTNTVRVSHSADVCAAVKTILARTYPDASLVPIDRAFDTFTRLYAGTLSGYAAGCDTWYHDAQHSLDCALAMARLLDGHERSCAPGKWLGSRRGVLGVIIALFHDSGYIRRDDDRVANGAEFTLSHVARSGEFLAQFLPRAGFAAEVDLTQQLVHFTGYEVALNRIGVSHPQDRMLGFLLGTADILAQTSDGCYLEKCRDYLYREFELCGLAGAGIPGGPKPIYSSVRDLLNKTPDYNRKLWEERLDGYFLGAYHCLEAHFGGANPYVEQVRRNLGEIQRLIRNHRFKELRKRPQVIGAAAMRQQLKPLRASGRKPAAARIHAAA
ncbi:MAG: hypothetical protein ACRETW_07235 [Stenotrophobium sp.]